MAPTLSDPEPSIVNELVITKGFGVKGLSESGLDRLPRQYIQPLSERISFSGEVSPEDSIPVIDMTDWDNSKAADSVCDAAEKWGFFQIVNHGVPLQVLENVQLATSRFFGQKAEEKNRFSRENSVSNSVRYGTSFTPQAETALEWKDYLSLFYVSDDEASALWPLAVKDEVLEYMKQSETVIKRLLRALMQRLNVSETDFTKRENLLMGSQRINLNYYPVCPNPELAVGVGRHSDVSTLTVLLQDDIGGLYVRAENEDRWIHVSPIKGSLVINVGDALQIMSNGRYQSVEHRVAANRSSDRISVPIFVNPRPSDTIFPFSEVLTDGKEAIYKRVLYSDYVKHFFGKAHDGKRTVDFAKI